MEGIMSDNTENASDASGAPDRDSTTSTSAAGTSRRDFLKGGAGLVAGATIAQLLPGEASGKGKDDGDETLDRLERANGDSGRRILIKGGTVITMDPAVPDLERGDVLIEGKK